MAVIYYPKSSIMYRKDTISASYETLVLSANPNTILYFDTGSGLNALSASILDLSCSYAVSSSYAPPVASVSASYALSASYAGNGGSGPGGGTDILMVQVFS